MRVIVVVAAAAATACLADRPADYDYGRAASFDDGPSSAMASSSAASSPQFGATTRHSPAPPPLSGGTMAVVPRRAMVVAADPDRDVVYLIDLDSRNVTTVALAAGDEPGRVVVDSSMRAHVALRSGASLATIALDTGAVVKRAVCTLPRGVAWDPATDEVHVACADGELVTLPASGGPPTRVVQVARDLRDVVVTPAGLVVSTFRDADIIRLAADGSVQMQAERNGAGGITRVAWRMIALPGDSSAKVDPAVTVMLAAQRTPGSFDVPPPTPPSYYGVFAGCASGGPLTIVTDWPVPVMVPTAVLPLDVATDGNVVVLVSAANAYLPDRPQVVFLYPSERQSGCTSGSGVVVPDAEITSIVHEPMRDRFYALSREPAALFEVAPSARGVFDRIALSTASVRDTGHAIFHASSGAGGVACASCHPEGRDDGHAWRSVSLGARRTPSLVGTLAGTAPYHWNGEARGLEDLMTMTFTERMRGPALKDDQRAAIAGWLGELPPLRRASTPASFAPAVARGQAIFESATARCSSCHSGPMRTNNASVDVGTGGLLQVPSLNGVVHRAPYLHDGSRPHLRAVVQRPHAGATVREDEIEDLVAFLGSL